jgi:hypothetical protein
MHSRIGWGGGEISALLKEAAFQLLGENTGLQVFLLFVHTNAVTKALHSVFRAIKM